MSVGLIKLRGSISTEHALTGTSNRMHFSFDLPKPSARDRVHPPRKAEFL